MAANLTGAPRGFTDAVDNSELKGPVIEKAFDMPTTYRRVYVWELPVRIFHWMNALVLLIMAGTGLLIAYPFVLFNAQEPSQQYWFGWVRFLHFAAGYVFFFNFLFRMYWSFAGNKYANWRNFIPHNPKQLQGVWTVLTTDIIPIRSKRRLSMGHNELANFSYFILYVLILLQCAVGFGLMSDMSGFFVAKMFGWVVPFLGGDAAARSWHHVLMWMFMIFTVVHVYLVFFHDWIEGRGVTSSIIGGWKFRKDEDIL